MNPATALATVLVDELYRGGVTEAVLAPGSWSTPLAIALAEHGDIRLHVRIDERSAGFVALGLAKRSGVPVPVVCTSGTAVANLHPAVAEADQARVPLLVLSADRPFELADTGSSQTIDQVKIFGDAVRLFVEMGMPEARAGSNAYWRSVTSRALAATVGATPGPVQVNLRFRKPLVPTADQPPWPESLAGRSAGEPWTRVLRPGATPVAVSAAGRGLMVVADGAVNPAAALAFARAAGWPVYAEPTSGARYGEDVIVHAGVLLSLPEFCRSYQPEQVITVGKPTLAPAVLGLAAGADHTVVDPGFRWADPGRSAQTVIPDLAPEPLSVSPDLGWSADWRKADAAVADVLADVWAIDDSELTVARTVMAAAPLDGLVFVGASMPIRDVDATMPLRDDVTVLTNRGAAGIDGVVSSAIGAALAHQRAGGGPAVALVGDLSMLHDQNALVMGEWEPRPDLAIVVVNNDGGAIFTLLPQARLAPALFERVMATPHGVDLAAVAAATGTPYQLVASAAELRRVVSVGQGIRLIEVRTDRNRVAIDRDRLVREVTAALG